MHWLEYWNLKRPPFHTRPLSFMNPSEFVANFVHTSVTNELDGLLQDIRSSDAGAPHLLIGGYGSGKSTLLNYVALELRDIQNTGKPFFPIYCGLTNPASVLNAPQ